jgi:putative endonuclease
MARHNTTGKSGERLAGHWIEKKGYRIMEQNWRSGHLEIDLIVSKENVLYFIEVKTARTIRYGYPEQKVTRRKWLNIRRASMAYLKSHPWNKRICYHILSISMDKPDPTYFLIEDVFLF